MRWTSSHNHPDGLKFIIEHDFLTDKNGNNPVDGFYLYIYENPAFYEGDLHAKDCKKFQDNYLQDYLNGAKSCALREFGVPEDSWVEVSEQIG